MPNIKSSVKDAKKSAEKRLFNKSVKSKTKTAVKNALTSVEEATPEMAEKVTLAVSALDKSASKGVIHKNKAARIKSRLAKKMAKASL